MITKTDDCKYDIDNCVCEYELENINIINYPTDKNDLDK